MVLSSPSPRTPRATAGRSRATRSGWSTPMGVITLAMLGSLAVLAVAGAVLWGQAADRPDPSAVLRAPTASHLLGTDHLGRDLLARLLSATWLSLLPAVAATLLGATAGITLGALTAVVGGRARRLLGALINLLLAFPALLVAMFFAALFGAGAGGAVCALAVACAPGFARITQTLAAKVAGTDFMAAARVLGLSRHRLLLRHVLPHIAEPLMLNITVAAGSALVALSGLSFLGLGVQPPRTTGGSCSARAWTASTPNRWPPWHPASPSSTQPWPSNCSARCWPEPPRDASAHGSRKNPRHTRHAPAFRQSRTTC